MLDVQRKGWRWSVLASVAWVAFTALPASAETRVSRAEHAAPTCETKAEARARRKAARKERAAARWRKSRAARKEAREERPKRRKKESPKKQGTRALAQSEREVEDDFFSPAPKPEPERRVVRAPVREEPLDVPVETEEALEEASESADPQAGSLVAALAVYSGMTWRSIELPTVAGPAALDTGVLPSVGLQLGARWRGSPYYALTLNYQSSLGAEATQAANDPQKPVFTTSIHSHHFEGGIAAGFSLGDTPDTASLGLYLGYGIRALGSVAELGVPRFSLHGPLARVELELPLGTPWLVLRIAPEAQLIVSVSDDLVEAALIHGLVFAYGGEAGLRLRVATNIALQLAFREAHAVVSTLYGPSFQDVERFALLGLVIHYQ